MKHVQNNGNGKRAGGITGKGFVKGKSGNPGGRPKTYVSITEACRADALADLENVVKRMKAKYFPLYLAYAFGKPVETQNLNVNIVAGLDNAILDRAQKIAREEARRN